MTAFYSQNKTKANGEKYIYYNPQCKECDKKRSYSWILENKEQYEINRSRHMESEKFKRTEDERRNRDYVKDYRKKWRQENGDYFSEFSRNRNSHKKHNISNKELAQLYEYCDHSCMYCGMSEDAHKMEHGQKLHKDHAINNGSNGIENCVMSCKSCNSSKRNRDWNEWYVPRNPNYTIERYVLIEKWLNSFKASEVVSLHNNK